MRETNKEAERTERAKGTALEDYTNILEKSSKEIVEVSRQLDEFEYGDIQKPPYEPKNLLALVERNDSIMQLVETLATNVALFGHGIKYSDEFDYNKAEEKHQEEAQAEWEKLRVKYKNINPLEDFSQLLYKALIDKYTIGWGCLEVLRNGKGEVTTLEYIRSCNVRIAKNKHARTMVEMWEETEKGLYEKTESPVKFKKFVQMVNGSKVFFKEFGDPRKMNCKNGEYRENVEGDELATELILFNSHSSYTDYGVPFWINTAISASGSIMADTLNYKYFSDGKILPMAVTVSGGQITKESIRAIREGKGIENAYKILVLEAVPDIIEHADGTKTASVVKIDIKSLTDTTNSDSLFQEYQKQSKEKIRDASRIPPIFTGSSGDYTRATADTARAIAEEQIFIPERGNICSKFNKNINNEQQVKYCEMYLKGAVFSDLEARNTMLQTLTEAGAVTPNIVLDLMGQLLNKDLEPWDEELGNIPFQLLLQREAAENQNNDPVKRNNEMNMLEVVKSEIRKSLGEVG